MKRKRIMLFLPIIIALTLIVTTLFNMPVKALSADAEKVKVNGSYEIHVAPNMAIVEVGVETSNMNATTATEENSAKMQEVLSVLKNNQILSENIKTTRFYVHEKHNLSTNEHMGFTVCNTLQFEYDNLKNLSTLLNELTESGANVVNGITFKLSNYNSYYNDALSGAVNNAKEKLKTLNLNLENYKIKSILEEQSYNYASTFLNASMLKNVSNESFIESGNVTIKAQVKVEFVKI